MEANKETAKETCYEATRNGVWVLVGDRHSFVPYTLEMKEAITKAAGDLHSPAGA